MVVKLMIAKSDDKKLDWPDHSITVGLRLLSVNRWSVLRRDAEVTNKQFLKMKNNIAECNGKINNNKSNQYHCQEKSGKTVIYNLLLRYYVT